MSYMLQQLRRAGLLMALAGRDFFHDNGPSWAAAIAYYSLLSLFPLLLAAASIGAFFVEPQWVIEKATDYLADLLPHGSGQIERIVKDTFQTARSLGLYYLIPLLWTGSLVFNAIAKALHVIFKTEDQVGLWKALLRRLVMLLVLGGMFLAALASSSVLRILTSGLGMFPESGGMLLAITIYTLPALFILATFSLAYRYIPPHGPRWPAALLGAGVATVLYTAAKPLFLGYVQGWSRYNLVYGSITGIIVVVLWTWVVAMIGLFGAQLSTHAQSVFDGHSFQEIEQQHLTSKDSEGPR